MLYAGYGKIFQRGKSEQQEGSETMKQDFIPLDRDTLTRLIYIHDDEITELTQKLLALEEILHRMDAEKLKNEV